MGARHRPFQGPRPPGRRERRRSRRDRPGRRRRCGRGTASRRRLRARRSQGRPRIPGSSLALTPCRRLGPHGDTGSRGRPARRRCGGPAARCLAGRLDRAAPARAPDRLPVADPRRTDHQRYGLGRPGSFVVDGVSFHDGIDISSFCGARITAAHDGVVLVAGRRFEAFVGWVGDLAPFRARLEKAGGWGGQAIIGRDRRRQRLSQRLRPPRAGGRREGPGRPRR